MQKRGSGPGDYGLGRGKNVGDEVRCPESTLVQSLVGQWREFTSSLSEMGSHLQLCGQWTAGGARAEVRYHLGGYVVI